jgi:hypothetical protein
MHKLEAPCNGDTARTKIARTPVTCSGRSPLQRMPDERLSRAPYVLALTREESSPRVAQAAPWAGLPRARSLRSCSFLRTRMPIPTYGYRDSARNVSASALSIERRRGRTQLMGLPLPAGHRSKLVDHRTSPRLMAGSRFGSRSDSQADHGCEL